MNDNKKIGKTINIVSNIKRINFLKERIENHHLCYNFEENSKYYIFLFPYKIKGLDGIRIAKGNNKSKALESLLYQLQTKFNDSLFEV